MNHRVMTYSLDVGVSESLGSVSRADPSVQPEQGSMNARAVVARNICDTFILGAVSRPQGRGERICFSPFPRSVSFTASHSHFSNQINYSPEKKCFTVAVLKLKYGT